MPRKGTVEKRRVAPDPKYKSEVVAKFINCLMKDGKKSIARSILYEAFDIIGQRSKKDPLEVFNKALENTKPIMEVRSRRVGGATYQVPTEVRPVRAQALAIRWLIQFARGRSGKSMAEKLAAEILDAYNNRGGAIKKKDDTHRMAEANKAFAHYRW